MYRAICSNAARLERGRNFRSVSRFPDAHPHVADQRLTAHVLQEPREVCGLTRGVEHLPTRRPQVEEHQRVLAAEHRKRRRLQ
jgi:hypothetical protein